MNFMLSRSHLFNRLWPGGHKCPKMSKMLESLLLKEPKPKFSECISWRARVA